MTLHSFISSPLFLNLKACNPSIPGLHSSILNDNESVLAAILLTGNVSLLQQASEAVREDKATVSTIIAIDPAAIRFAAMGLRENPEFILEISNNYPDVLYFIDYKKVNNEHVRKRYLELRGYSREVIEILYGDISVLEEDEELAKTVIARNPIIIMDVPSLGENKELLLTTIPKNPLVIEYSSEDIQEDKEFMKQAVALDAGCYLYSGERQNQLRVGLAMDFLKHTGGHPAAYLQLTIEEIIYHIEDPSTISRLVRGIANKGDMIEVLSRGLWYNEILTQDYDKYFRKRGKLLNKEDWKTILKSNYRALPEELKNDVELIKAVIQEAPELYSMIPNELKENKEIAMTCLALCPYLRDVPSSLDADADLWRQIYKRSKYPSVLTLFLNANAFSTDDIKETAILSLKDCPTESLKHVAKKISYSGTESDKLLAADPRFIMFLANPTTEACIQAAKKGYPKALSKIDTTAFGKMTLEEIKELVLLYPNVLAKVPTGVIDEEKMNELTLLAIQNGGTKATFIRNDNEAAMLKLLENKGSLYNEIGKKLKARSDYAAAAMRSKKNSRKKFPKLLVNYAEWASEVIQYDKTLMREYVKLDKDAYVRLPQEMKEDPEIAINSMIFFPKHISYLPDALSQNLPFLLKLVTAAPRVLDFTSYEVNDLIQHEKKFALAAVALDAKVLKSFSKAIQMDIDVIIAALGSKNNSGLVHIPYSLIFSKSFQTRAREAVTMRVFLQNSNACKSLDIPEEKIIECIDKHFASPQPLESLALHHAACNNRTAKHYREALLRNMARADFVQLLGGFQ